jgi:uncharacterized membrane protein YgcG
MQSFFWWAVFAPIVRRAVGCSTAIVDCGDGYPTVTLRTLDWDSQVFYQAGGMQFVPPNSQNEASLNQPTKLGYAKQYFQVPNTTDTLAIDGMNEQGLSCAILQNSLYISIPSSPGDKEQVNALDFCSYILGKYATVSEVEQALANGDFDLSTTVPSDLSAEQLEVLTKALGATATQVDENTMAYQFHWFISDGAKEGLYLTGKCNISQNQNCTGDGIGYETRYARALTNDALTEDFVLGVDETYGADWANTVPYNSYSRNRFARLHFALKDCQQFMYPNSSNLQYGEWSPTYGTDDESKNPTADVYSALKRGENILNSIVLPRSGFNTESESTQASFLKVPDVGLYYYASPADDGWQEIDLKKLSKAGKQVEFQIFTPGSFGTEARVLNADLSTGGQSSSTGGQSSSTGGQSSSTGGQSSSTGGQPTATSTPPASGVIPAAGFGVALALAVAGMFV